MNGIFSLGFANTVKCSPLVIFRDWLPWGVWLHMRPGFEESQIPWDQVSVRGSPAKTSHRAPLKTKFARGNKNKQANGENISAPLLNDPAKVPKCCLIRQIKAHCKYNCVYLLVKWTNLSRVSRRNTAIWIRLPAMLHLLQGFLSPCNPHILDSIIPACQRSGLVRNIRRENLNRHGHVVLCDRSRNERLCTGHIAKDSFLRKDQRGQIHHGPMFYHSKMGLPHCPGFNWSYAITWEQNNNSE